MHGIEEEVKQWSSRNWNPAIANKLIEEIKRLQYNKKMPFEIFKKK